MDGPEIMNTQVRKVENRLEANEYDGGKKIHQGMRGWEFRGDRKKDARNYDSKKRWSGRPWEGRTTWLEGGTFLMVLPTSSSPEGSAAVPFSAFLDIQRLRFALEAPFTEKTNSCSKPSPAPPPKRLGLFINHLRTSCYEESTEDSWEWYQDNSEFPRTPREGYIYMDNSWVS